MKLSRLKARSQASKPAVRGPAAAAPPELRITELAYEQLKAGLSAGAPERGMALFGFAEDGVVRVVVADDTAQCTGASYTPDVDRLNRLSDEVFTPAGLVLLGFVHSHPGALSRPSGADLEYAAAILTAFPTLPHLLLPIVTLFNGFAIHPYVAVRAGKGARIERAKLTPMREALTPAAPGTPQAPSWRARLGLPQPAKLQAPWWEAEAFARVRTAYDLERLAHCCIFVAGVGGAMAGIEDLARCGVRRIVLVDPDRVAEANLATQAVSRSDLGKPKVAVLGRRIRAINPHARVITRMARLEDIEDEEFARLAGLRDPEPPQAVVLLGMTDCFAAQAQVNRLGLRHEIGSVCGQLYERGLAGEVTFVLPGVSRGCHRCLLEARYRAYDEGFENTVTSHGSPISSTERINSIVAFLTLAILHHGSGHPRWDGIARELATRNLIQFRMHPDASLGGFGTGTDPISRFDAVRSWRLRPLDGAGGRPRCPDCGGTGVLRDAGTTSTEAWLSKGSGFGSKARGARRRATEVRP